jgi:hypothetical protein
MVMTEKQQAVITAENGYLTLINAYTCPESRQHELIAALERAVAEVFVNQPGFISASIHASLDRPRVLNYVQWVRVEDFDTAGGVSEIQERMAEIMAFAEAADPRLFQVRSVHQAP